MRVIVAGGRDYSDYDRVKAELDKRKEKITLILSGACRLKGNWEEGYASGADGLGERWADENGVRYIRFFAEDYGKWPEAGPKRNTAMVNFALKSEDGGALIAFPGGRGTADVIKQAKAKGLAGVEIE